MLRSRASRMCVPKLELGNERTGARRRQLQLTQHLTAPTIGHDPQVFQEGIFGPMASAALHSATEHAKKTSERSTYVHGCPTWFSDVVRKDVIPACCFGEKDERDSESP